MWGWYNMGISVFALSLLDALGLGFNICDLVILSFLFEAFW